MAQTPGWDVSCSNCLEKCDTTNLDSISDPYSYSVNMSPNYKKNMKCVKSCYEKECKGASSWPSGTWTYEGYQPRQQLSEKSIKMIIIAVLIIVFLYFFGRKLSYALAVGILGAVATFILV